MKGEKKMKKDSVINNAISTDALAANSANNETIQSKSVKTVKSNKNNKSKGKNVEVRPNVFIRMGRWFKRTFKDMVSELKKVSWPTFAKGLSSTGIVLVVVLFFLVVLTGMDALLGFGFNSLIGLGS